MGDSNIDAFGQCIGKLTGLLTLNLKGNSIGDKGSGVLSNYLVHLKRMNMLHMSDNDLTERGARAMDRALTTLPEVRVLY